MNNRFKFRVWYKPYNGYVERRDDLVLLSDGILCEYDGMEIDSDNYIIEQCTGLKDINRNLIYEGDLLGGFPVVWVNELNGFRVKINTIHGWDWHYINEFTNQKITGNIHEQSEQKEKQR